MASWTAAPRSCLHALVWPGHQRPDQHPLRASGRLEPWALWGATSSSPGLGEFKPKTDEIRKVRGERGDVEGSKKATRFALSIDSPTAVRTLNALLGSGVTAELALAPFTNSGEQMPAGTVLFPTSARDALEDAADDSGLTFVGVKGRARQGADRPRAADRVLNGQSNRTYGCSATSLHGRPDLDRGWGSLKPAGRIRWTLRRRFKTVPAGQPERRRGRG